MELDEAIRRVAGQHWKMILAFVAAATVATALLNSYTPTYSASARLVLDAEDPQSRAEASGIADTARAIATSPGQIEAATRAARVTGHGSVDVDRLDVELESL